MKKQYSQITQQFETHTIDPTTFSHQEHVLVAYEMLLQHSFLDASMKYAKGIETMAIKAGAPEKFHMTITMAFLSLIAERLHQTKAPTFKEFLAQNQDLLSKSVLNRWYSNTELQSDFARTHLLLPTRVPNQS